MVNWSNLFMNFRMVFSDWRFSLLAFFVFFLFEFVFLFFSNSDLTIGNLGLTFFVVEQVVQFLIAFLFGIFVAISVFKIVLFTDFSGKKKTSAGILGGIVSVLVAGCPACSITLASYVGLTGFFSIFPFYGLELKVLTIPLLMWVNYDILSKLTACEVDLKSKKKK